MNHTMNLRRSFAASRFESIYNNYCVHTTGGGAPRSTTNINRNNPHLLIQHRHYLYLPTSWTELKLRMRAAADRRTVKVKLLLNKSRAIANNKYATAVDRYQVKSDRFRTRQKAARQRLETSKRHLKSNVSGFWKQSKTAFYYTRPVTLTEYSEEGWFDAAGRPLTSQDATGRFVNPWLSQSTDGVHSIAAIFSWRRDRLQREWAQHGFWGCVRLQILAFWLPLSAQPYSCPCPTPTETPNLKEWNGESSDLDKLQLTWIGHSTCLIRNGETTILTDPIFSVRSSPWQSLPVGEARKIPPAVTIDELPTRIDVCLISHDHYDHLDKPSVFALSEKVGIWVVPSGISQWLQDKCDIPANKIVECEWWESVRLVKTMNDTATTDTDTTANGEQPEECWREVQRENTATAPIHPAIANKNNSSTDNTGLWLTCCPVQHWSSRTYFDRNFRLWCSWAVFFPRGKSFYFAGDTALPPVFPLFEQISDYLGPIDLAALPIGAYEPDYFMAQSHMDPAEAVYVHKALQCQKSVAIHWGSFDLAEEPMDEPPLLLKQAVDSDRAEVDFVAIPNGASIETI